MISDKLKYLFSMFMMLTTIMTVNAQVKLQSYIDIGENNVSGGVFVKNVYRSSYQYQKYNAEAGLQFDLVSNNPNKVSGLDIGGSRKSFIRDYPFDIKGFFILNRFSDLQHETNWGIRIETRKPEHFLLGLGTGFRTYAINSSAIDKYNVSKTNAKLRENFNLLYNISAYLKPHDHDWNIGLSCTNVDYYIINQSTNPVFNLQMKYKLKSKLTIYLDSWYKQAGIFNINANHSGYFFRGGVQWEI